MEGFKTPLKGPKKNPSIIHIPPSPQMKRLGYGTGVSVYEFQRSPLSDKFRSPWAVKKLNKTIKNKQIADCANNRLQVEAEILRKLNHPNIVGFRAFTKDSEGLNVLVMEECDTSLGDLIENRLDYLGNVPYPAETILKVSHDISKALGYLHYEMLILHCDVKSFNVLVRGEFEICKLCDFGVSLPLTKSGEVDLTKSDGQLEYRGTPLWSPPEALLPEPIITTKTDIYAFGLVLWEMLSLSPPIDDYGMLGNDENDSYLSNVSTIACSDDKNGLSQKSEEEEVQELPEPKEKKRPALPDVELGPEYNVVLEMYFCCTAYERDKRLSTHHLVVLLDHIMERKNLVL